MDITSTKELGENVGLSEASRELIRSANKGKVNTERIGELRELLAKSPFAWKLVGDLNEQVRRLAIQSLGENCLREESVQHGLTVLRHDLGYENSSGLERLAIEQILTCWVQSCVVGAKLEATTKSGHSMAQGMYWEKRFQAAHMRLMRAIELLGRLRKIAGPVLQVNIGDKQINVA